ncbi:hypothetical protein [Pontibacter liquoris]|uniref:hypothetical protein n=1 Tax=Pontibacter liquoris TaxID=2905677 RepID=UPI001FA76AE1|nr:hypothetical protein [Pontibacter liquoris]
MMKKNSLKHTMLALTFGALASTGLVACNKGTEPGDTNTERGKIEDTGDMVGAENKNANDTATDLEDKYYKDADDANNGKVQQGDSIKRPEGGNNE